ncbi:MAG: GPW/gp25 family protein [Lachnospiraceae bacterium]|nr:GPW/gp25 family protein [Lachnospiraceae bacterium]
MDASKDFLGRGFSFPPKIDPATGKFVMAEAEEDIQQSIYIILMTRLKERAMLPEFGTDLSSYIYDVPDPTFENLLCMEVLNALVKYEHRIQDIDVSIDDINLAKGAIYIRIKYFVRATNNPNNLVFPYYIEEGIGEL